MLKTIKTLPMQQMRTTACVSLLLMTQLLTACSSGIKTIVSKDSHTKASNSNPLINNRTFKPDLICNTPQLYANRIVGDGHCVSLIKKCAQAPQTSFWRPGPKVLNFQNQLPIGTIIATFKGSKYPNRVGYHAAIYISHDKEGIWVWDQWRGKPVHRRLIRTRYDKNATASNSAQAYSVVKLASN